MPSKNQGALGTLLCHIHRLKTAVIAIFDINEHVRWMYLKLLYVNRILRYAPLRPCVIEICMLSLLWFSANRLSTLSPLYLWPWCHWHGSRLSFWSWRQLYPTPLHFNAVRHKFAYRVTVCFHFNLSWTSAGCIIPWHFPAFSFCVWPPVP